MGNDEAADLATDGRVRALDRKAFMTLEESQALSRVLARRSAAAGAAPDLVVGLANGALLPMKVVAGELSRPFEVVRMRREGSRLKQRLLAVKRALHIPSAWLSGGPVGFALRQFERRFGKSMSTEIKGADDAFGFDVRGRRVLLVDDCVVTGASLRLARAKLLTAGAAEVRTAAICWFGEPGDPGATDMEPDVWLHRLVHFYPWSANSPDLGRFEAWLAANGLELWE